MINVFNWFRSPKEMVPGGSLEPEFNPNGVYIRQMKNGRWRLLENGNELVATYARYRDAVRGAARRGLVLTEGVRD